MACTFVAVQVGTKKPKEELDVKEGTPSDEVAKFECEKCDDSFCLHCEQREFALKACLCGLAIIWVSTAISHLCLLLKGEDGTRVYAVVMTFLTSLLLAWCVVFKSIRLIEGSFPYTKFLKCPSAYVLPAITYRMLGIRTGKEFLYRTGLWMPLPVLTYVVGGVVFREFRRRRGQEVKKLNVEKGQVYHEQKVRGVRV